MHAVVTAPLAPLYTAADNTAERADEALHGMGVEILSETRGFYHVRTLYRYEGYVEKAHVLLGADYTAGRMRVYAPFCDIMGEKRITGEVITTLPRGAHLAVEGGADEKGWVPVRLACATPGFAMACSLRPYPLVAGGEAAMRQSLVATARDYLGVQYRWGGKTPWGVDCSGLCSMVYLLHGYTIYRDAAIKPGFDMREIPLEQTKPGDLMFFKGHVGLCLGGLRFIHSTLRSDAAGVTCNSLDEGDADYHAGLKESYLHSGSVFPQPAN